jgi:hypothetical protein
MTTLRQIEANQRNSLKSSGPKSTEGKERSRQNALKHGLSGAGTVLPDDEQALVEQRKAEWRLDFRPMDPREEWLFDQLVTASVQLDRCQREEQAMRSALAARAAVCWDDDRRLATEVLAGGLSRKPSLVSRQLRQTAQGCDWLIERWESLGRILETRDEWSEPQKTLALDLLGTSPELRDGPTRLDPLMPEDDVRAHRAALVAAEVAQLQEARETYLADLDDRERAAAELGLAAEIPAPLARLRRYAAACERRFRWTLNQLGRARKARAEAEPETTAAPEAPPAPSPTTDPAGDWDALMRGLDGIPVAVADVPAPTASTSAPYPTAPRRFAGRIEAFSAAAPSLADPPRRMRTA